jgi:hypothetical protein
MGFGPLRRDFETIDTGSYPSGWERDGSQEQRVVDTTSFSGSHSLELVGSHGGCWQAIANAPLGDHPGSDPVRFTGAVKPAVEGQIGCHDGFAPYGNVLLRTAVGSWSDGETRHLLRLRDDVVHGAGLDLGSYTRGEWLSYEVRYEYRPDDETVALRYIVDGERRGETTVDAIDAETDLSHLAFRSGDFTAYWDDLVVKRATGTPTPQSTTQPPTATPHPTTRPPTATPQPTTRIETPTAAPYDLRDARQRTEVTPVDRTLYVLRGIPGADGQPAVTTPEYRLVDADAARDAFVTYVAGRSPTGFDWEDELSYARTMRGKHGASELWNRAATIGWDALAAYAMAQVNPAAAIGPIIETLQDSVAWTVQEITDPYMEAMTKQSRWTHTYREIEADVERADSLVELTDFMVEFVQIAKSVKDLAGTWDDALAAARTAYSASGSFTTSLAAGGAAVSNAVYYAAIGELVSRGVDTVTTGMEQNAKLSAIGHAYSTTRIPVIERIIDLQRQRRDNNLSPCGAWELAYLTMNHHYMGAFANHGMYKHAHAIEQSTLGGVWDVLVNLDEVASVLEDRASTYQWGGAAAHRNYGDLMERAGDLTADSINREVDGAPTPLGGAT